MPADAPLNPLLPALTELMREVRPGLVRFFHRRCMNVSRAEDLAQEVIARTLNRPDLTTLDSARGYIFRSAANLWHDERRRRLTRSALEVEWDDEAVHNVAGEIPPERVVQGKELLHLVNTALLELTERTRHVFVLNRYEQMTYAAIAETLGISESAVEKHMSKALAHLFRRVNE